MLLPINKLTTKDFGGKTVEFEYVRRKHKKSEEKMNIKGQLKKLFTVLTMSGLVFGATATPSPTDLPIGAAVNVSGVDHNYVQSIKFVFQNNGPGAWANGEDVVINLPSNIGVADVDGDGAYTDGISIIASSAGHAITPAVAAATANSITIDMGAGVNIVNADNMTVVFPITTSSSAANGSTQNYSIIYGQGNEEVGGENANPAVTFRSSLSVVTSGFNANYAWNAQVSTVTIAGTVESDDKFTATINGTETAAATGASANAVAAALELLIEALPGVSSTVAGAVITVTGDVAGTAFTLAVATVEANDDDADAQTIAALTTTPPYDETDELGYKHPVAGATSLLASNLPDLVVEPNDLATDLYVNGDDAQFEGITYNAVNFDDHLYEIWASKTKNLTQVNATNGFKLLAAHDIDNTFPASNGYEGAAFPTVQLKLDADAYNNTTNGAGADTKVDFEEDVWFFYVTSNLTADWVLQGGAAVTVKHHPVFVAEGGANVLLVNHTSAGLDYDGDNDYEGGGHDNVANMFIDSDIGSKNIIGRSGVVPAGADGSGTAQINSVKFYMNTQDVDDASTTDVWISTTDGMGEANLTISGSAPSETVTLANATKVSSSSVAEGQNGNTTFTMTNSTAEGNYYVYFVTNDGKNQNVYQAQTDGPADKFLKVSHYPYFEFSQVQSGDAYAHNTAELTSFPISWAADNVNGDFDQDDNATITLYACTGNYAAVINATHNTADLASCLQIGGSIAEDTDTQAGNTYDWNVRNGKSQVSTVTAANAIEVGDIFSVTLNGSTVSFTATLTTVANVASGLEPLVHALAGVSATSNAGVVTIIADVPGTAFTLSSATTEAGGGASDAQTLVSATTTASGAVIPAATYEIVAKIDDGGGHVFYQQLKSNQAMTNAGQDDRSVVVSHSDYFFPINPSAGTPVSLNHSDTYEFRWEAFDQDATASNCKIAIFLSTVSGITSDYAAFDGADAATGVAVTSADGRNHTETVLASAGKYLFDIDKITKDMANANRVPNGTYYVYYYFSVDGTFSNNEFPYQADGTLAIATTDAGAYSDHKGFEILPNTPVVNKGDVIDFTVYANDGDQTAEIISFGITFDNTKLSASDMITADDGVDNDNDGSIDEDNGEDSGTQPFQTHGEASSTFVLSAAPAVGAELTLVNTAGVSKVYIAVADGGTNGNIAAGKVQFQRGNSGADDAADAILCAGHLKAAIEHANGHNGSILVSGTAPSVTVTQKVPSAVGNAKTCSGNAAFNTATSTNASAFAGGFGWNGIQLTNTISTDGTTDEIKFVQWEDGGTALTGDAATGGLAIAKFKLTALAHNATASMESHAVTFQTSGLSATKIVANNNADVSPIVSGDLRGSSVKLVSRGSLSGNIDIEGRTDAAQTVTITLSSTGSYTEISDATYNATQGDVITLGTGGSYTLSQIPAGRYKVRVSKDGWVDQVVDNVKIVDFSTTYLHFTGGDLLYGGDVVGYINASGAAVPDNSIVVADASAIANSYFGLAADASAGAGYSDVDGDGTVYVADLNYSTKNAGASKVGEGLLYKPVETDNNESLIALNKVETSNDRVVYTVSGSRIGALRAYAIEMDITDDWALVSREDHLKVNGQAIEFDKSNGHAVTLVSALIGDGSALMPNQDLVTIVLQPLVNDPVEPVITEATLIDDQNRSAKAVISNNGLVMPNEFILNQNFPNPFNPVTNIAFAIPQDGMVKLTVFDLMGREVRELVSSRLSGGNYSANWNATNTFGSKVSSGLYFYSLTVDNKMIATQKMILMK